jgi:hypothetical protein
LPLDSPLSTRQQNRLSGDRNTATNFFASQITDDAGSLDVAGTFGALNHNPPKNVASARQGYDIVNVDVSAHLDEPDLGVRAAHHERRVLLRERARAADRRRRAAVRPIPRCRSTGRRWWWATC